MGKPARGTKAGEGGPPPVEAMVWVFFVAALAATLFVLLREPEDGPPAGGRTFIQVQMLAVVASVLGGMCGVVRIVTRGGDDNLFAMAVVFNLVLGSFWILRLLFGAHAVPVP